LSAHGRQPFAEPGDEVLGVVDVEVDARHVRRVADALQPVAHDQHRPVARQKAGDEEHRAAVPVRDAAASKDRIPGQRRDVADARQCKAVIDELKPFGLVNNAGVPASGAIEDVTDEVARLAMETMVLGPIRLARLAIPHMRERRTGRIVNISSVYGLMTTPLTGWYQAAKHALEALSDALRVEVASDGIAVALIEPGAFRSNIWEGAGNDLQRRIDSGYLTAYKRLETGIKAGQRLMGDPIEVARVISGVM